MSFIRHIVGQVSLWIIDITHVAKFWISMTWGRGGLHDVRLMIVDERRVLLVTHWYAPWAWTLPGGSVEKNETGEVAAIRDAWEETGFTVNSIAGEIGTYTRVMGKRDKLTVYYTGDFHGSLAMKPNLEIMARSWFDMDSLPKELSPANRRRIQAYRDGVRSEHGKW